MAWMEHGLQISLKRYALSMEDKMAAGALGRATNYGRGGPSVSIKITSPVFRLWSLTPFILNAVICMTLLSHSPHSLSSNISSQRHVLYYKSPSQKHRRCMQALRFSSSLNIQARQRVLILFLPPRHVPLINYLQLICCVSSLVFSGQASLSRKSLPEWRNVLRFIKYCRRDVWCPWIQMCVLQCIWWYKLRR